jgi:hypothetical protein
MQSWNAYPVYKNTGSESAENWRQEELLPRKTTVVTNSSIGAFSCKMTSPLAIMAQIGLAEDNQQKLENKIT